MVLFGPWTASSPHFTHTLQAETASRGGCSCPGPRHACLVQLSQIPTVTFVSSIQGCWHLWKEIQSSNQFHSGFHTKWVGQQVAGAASEQAENFRAAGLTGQAGAQPRGSSLPTAQCRSCQQAQKDESWTAAQEPRGSASSPPSASISQRGKLRPRQVEGLSEGHCVLGPESGASDFQGCSWSK